MQKSCRGCAQKFEITPEDLAFYDKVSPVYTDKKCTVPPPTLCPDCRRQRRLAWQNMFKLYIRKCDLTGKNMVSMFSPDKKYIVYDSDAWWSDKWDPLKFGRPFDFTRPFFEQFGELMERTPLLNLSRRPTSDENADYTNYSLNNKNAYLLFHANNNEDCSYGFGVKFSKNCLDILDAFSSELLYECIDCENCYNLKYSQDCENCSDSWFLDDCLGCSNCIACHGLQHGECMVFNKKVSKEEYLKIEAELKSGSRKKILEWREKFDKFLLTLPHRPLFEKQNENCSGDHIYRCKNVFESFDIKDTEDARFCWRVFNGPNRDCYDIDQFGMKIEKVYECSVVGVSASNVLFGMICREEVSNLAYCMLCYFSSNLFGCIGLKHNKYCILNRQYTKEEYEELVPRIIEHMKVTGEWGEFFPAGLSPFGYNETVATEYFPLSKEKALKSGMKWSDYEAPEQDAKVIKAAALPDNIRDVTDEILKSPIGCEITGKSFRVTKQELKFYREQNLPLPRRHPDRRHQDRLSLRNPRKLFERSCAKCGNAMQTTYAPARPETVYCEKCYLEAVY